MAITKEDKSELQGMSVPEMLEAFKLGLVSSEDLTAEMTRRQDASSGEGNKKIKEIFTSKPNYLTVTFTGQGFPVSATVKKWELIGEQIAEIVARAKQVRAAGDDVTGLKFYRTAKESQESPAPKNEAPKPASGHGLGSRMKSKDAVAAVNAA